jgi:hypothetical protein
MKQFLKILLFLMLALFLVAGSALALPLISGNIKMAPIPEPVTMFIFGIGLVALGSFGRKKFFKEGKLRL